MKDRRTLILAVATVLGTLAAAVFGPEAAPSPEEQEAIVDSLTAAVAAGGAAVTALSAYVERLRRRGQ